MCVLVCVCLCVCACVCVLVCLCDVCVRVSTYREQLIPSDDWSCHVALGQLASDFGHGWQWELITDWLTLAFSLCVCVFVQMYLCVSVCVVVYA